MDIVAHRVNKIDDLRRLPPGVGAEVDIRSRGSDLILAHDPYTTGARLFDFLDVYAESRPEALLILNPKEDGLEEDVLLETTQRNLQRFFFLDLTLPTTVRFVRKKKEKRVAIRLSEFEPEGLAERFRGLAEWLWVDCFDGRPADPAKLRALRDDFKVCLVSPELQGYPADSISHFHTLRQVADAVCTKHPAQWQ
jgi:hypothetical protein